MLGSILLHGTLAAKGFCYYINSRLGYDQRKKAWNIRGRGLSFDDVALLDWNTAVVRQDRRKDYGENRFQALVEGAEGKPYVVVFTMRDETM
jgi:uncharacterized DUF497 family protein